MTTDVDCDECGTTVAVREVDGPNGKEYLCIYCLILGYHD